VAGFRSRRLVPLKKIRGESQILAMRITSTEDLLDDDSSKVTAKATRRECIERSVRQTASVMGITVSATSPWNIMSVAKAVTAAEPQQQTDSSPSSLCDPAVSSWQKQERTVHIIGTSHFSSVSADLAGKVVSEVRPDCLFIELDMTRVKLAFRGGRPTPGLKLAFYDRQGNLRLGTTRSSLDMNPISWLEQVISKLVQQEGFLEGEEMVTAVQKASNIGAVVVLGDRDFGVTLRRLAATSNNKMQKLKEANRVFLNQELPETREWGDSKRLSKEELRGFIETIKTKDMVTRQMDTWKIVAPEAYTVMITERDKYMSLSLDTLSSYNTAVAVMGLAHVDGVTRNLAAMGWHRSKHSTC